MSRRPSSSSQNVPKSRDPVASTRGEPVGGDESDGTLALLSDLRLVRKKLDDKEWLRNAKKALRSNATSLSDFKKLFSDRFVRFTVVAAQGEFDQIVSQVPEPHKAELQQTVADLRKHFPGVVSHPYVIGVTARLIENAAEAIGDASTSSPPAAGRVPGDLVVKRLVTSSVHTMGRGYIAPFMRVMVYDRDDSLAFDRSLEWSQVLYLLGGLTRHLSIEIQKVLEVTDNSKIRMDRGFVQKATIELVASSEALHKRLGELGNTPS